MPRRKSTKPVETKKEETPVEKAPEAAAAPKKESPKPEPKKDVVMSLEQVALSKAREMTPRFKSEHLPGLLAFCKSSGLPSSGTEAKMLEVLKRYGYKI